MRTRLTAGAVLVTAVALAGSALAAPAVTIGSATLEGGFAAVEGTASFDPASTGPVDVGGSPTTASAAPLAAFDAAGVDLQKAFITETDEGLVFTWKVRSLPASPPPETTRYTWGFTIGGTSFQLQAKRSNVASSTLVDDPAGHVGTLAGSAFQLRGNCVPNFNGTPAPVSNCPHLAFLTGAFDTARGEVRMEVPFGLEVAKEIAPGAALVASETAGMSISAAYQAVVSNTMVSTFINGWSTYYAGPAVEVGVGLEGDGEPLSTVQAVLADDGTYAIGFPVEDEADTAFVRACRATTCSETVSAPLG